MTGSLISVDEFSSHEGVWWHPTERVIIIIGLHSRTSDLSSIFDLLFSRPIIDFVQIKAGAVNDVLAEIHHIFQRAVIMELQKHNTITLYSDSDTLHI